VYIFHAFVLLLTYVLHGEDSFLRN